MITKKLARQIKDFFKTLNYKSCAWTLIGTFIVAFGTYNLNANSNVPKGGIEGIGLIIEKFTGISVSISVLIINLILYALAFRLLGTHFLFNTVLGTVAYSVFYAIFELFPPVIPSLVEYPLLVAFLGAIFAEVGKGIAIKGGGAPDPENAITVAFVKRGGINLNWFTFYRDVIIIIFSLAYADIYGVIFAIFVMTITMPISDYIAFAPKSIRITKRIYRTKRFWIPKVIAGVVALIIMCGGLFYLNDHYHTNDELVKKYVVENVEVIENKEDKAIIYKPTGEIKAGFVFYPGGKVEYDAYTPLLKECAANGILCIVVEMPYNLAIFGTNRALDVIPDYPEVTDWYIGGHSLGGTMAASCAYGNPSVFKGVILLASYSTSDITFSRVLSIYGTEDEILNEKNYNKNKENLPKKYEEYEIIGGNHAYFGMYGVQEGDGTPKISNVEQIQTTATYITNFILGQGE